MRLRTEAQLIALYTCASTFNVDCNYLRLESYVALLYFKVAFNYDVIYYVGRLREGSRRGSKERTIAQETHLCSLWGDQGEG
jgi:hypothetical protein